MIDYLTRRRMLAFSRIQRAQGSGPLSFRYDSLLVQCLIAAGIYFGPQDAALGFLAALNGRAFSNSINRPVEVADPQSAIDKFFAKKGLDSEDFNVRRGRSWEVSFAKMYK